MEVTANALQTQIEIEEVQEKEQPIWLMDELYLAFKHRDLETLRNLQEVVTVAVL